MLPINKEQSLLYRPISPSV